MVLSIACTVILIGFNGRVIAACGRREPVPSREMAAVGAGVPESA